MSYFGQALGAGAASAGIGLVGNVITGAINNAYAKKQYQREVETEQKIYDRNRADYLADLQNEREYNSPQAMLDRLREAGINPNVMNGGQLVSASASSGATPMPSGPSPSGSAMPGDSSIASGMASFSNAVVEQRKADEEIVGIKLSNRYKEIENDYLKIEKDLANEKTRTEIDQRIAETKKVFSDISVNDNTIKIGNRQYELFGKQMSLTDKQIALTVSKEAMLNLDIQKAKIMMPYCTKMAEAQLLLYSARTSAAVESAYNQMAQAELNFTLKAKEQGLVDAGWADSYVAQINQSIEQSKAQVAKIMEETKYVGFNAKTNRRRANASIMLGVSSLISAACNLGKTIQSFQPKQQIFGGSNDSISTSGPQYLLDFF